MGLKHFSRLFLSLFIIIYSPIFPLVVPDGFQWGVAMSEHQNSGAENCPFNNWTQWEQTAYKNGTSHIKDDQQSGWACDHWHLYEQDIACMKQLGVNAFRLSVEWSNIEPEKGIFNEDALRHYEEEVDALLEAAITPMITLHHFTHPQWFQEKGAFEHEKNSKYFVRFCKKVFQCLAPKVHLWCTINEPTIYMFQGYMRGVFPPGKTNVLRALRVLKNMLQAHTQVYMTLKEMPYGQDAQIGLVHQYLKFEPYYKWHVLEHLPGLFLNYILNTTVLNFLKTGTFNVSIPFIFSCKYSAPENQKLLDFIGINYYTRVLMKAQLSISEPLASSRYPDEVMTDMPYRLYPQGLYDAIADCASIGVPMYITECGIADAKDDRRASFFDGYLGALDQALTDGYDVRGFYYWSLMDNFEWDEGYHMKFGLYSVNRETQERIMRESAHYYIQAINASRT